MQRKVYIGGLPWEMDRIAILNYLKAILEENEIEASYELHFIASPVINPNAVVKVTDVFVALHNDTKKSRGFGFITLEFEGDDEDTLFDRIVGLLNERVTIGIRGPRELIVKEADPKSDDNDSDDASDDSEVDADW